MAGHKLHWMGQGNCHYDSCISQPQRPVGSFVGEQTDAVACLSGSSRSRYCGSACFLPTVTGTRTGSRRAGDQRASALWCPDPRASRARLATKLMQWALSMIVCHAIPMSGLLVPAYLTRAQNGTRCIEYGFNLSHESMIARLRALQCKIREIKRKTMAHCPWSALLDQLCSCHYVQCASMQPGGC